MCGATKSDTTRAQQRRWHSYANTDDLIRDVVAQLGTFAKECIDQRSVFHVVLAGGTTPRAVYEALRDIETDWSAWHIYFGDERCLPAGAEDRNDTMAQQSWLQHVSIPSRQIHAMPAELGNLRGAEAYRQVVQQVEVFDLVLLGLGEDGHTASLFPGQEWGDQKNAPAVLAVSDAPKAPPERISLSAYRLGQARRVWFLVTGEAKRGAVENWQDHGNLPAASICPQNGVDIYTDLELKSSD